MKKQITILIPLLLHLFSFAQHGKVIKINTSPCNDKFVDTYPGIWLPPNITFTDGSLTKLQQQELTKLFQTYFNFVKEAYPNPSGADGYWAASGEKAFFANQVKFLPNAEEESIKKNQVTRFDFNLSLFFYYCKSSQEISTGFPDGEWSGCGLNISANSLDNICKNVGSFRGDNRWRIDGRPIKLKLIVVGKWKGYDLCKQYGGSLKNESSVHYVLVSRPGILPYIPVTRKQYLDIAIPYITKFYDDQLADLDKTPLRSIEEQEAIKNKKIEEYKKKYPSNPGMLKQYLPTYTTDQQELERKKNIILKSKNDDLKKYHDEWDRDTKERLLGTPAIIAGDVEMMSERPVFTTEEQGGNLLITDNPDYFRKDLPATVPQFFVIAWWWDNGAPWRMRFKNAIEENFPVEKLGAMIDK